MMSNGLLSKRLRNIITNRTFATSGYVQVRAKTRQERKFLVPDSFRPHLNSKHKPRELSKGESRQGTKDGPEPPLNHDVVVDLDSNVESGVSTAAARELSLSTESVLQDFCGQTHHPYVSTSLKGYVNTTRMNSCQVQHYWRAIANYLPDDTLTGTEIMTSSGKLKHRSYTWASPLSERKPGDIGPSTNFANMGWHMFLFTNSITGNRLLFDGTDSNFLPGPATTWKHRLWAGGSINLYRIFQPKIESKHIYHQVERPVNVRIVGANQVPEKVFLTVRKSFHRIQDNMPLARYSISSVIRSLQTRPSRQDFVPAGGSQFEEEYTLCFLRNPPNLSESAATKVVAPPLTPKFSHTLTPDRHLLFCWSALSYNAHLIHLDSAFAKNEYGAKDLVVHGPLTLILILEWFQREITKYAIQRQLPRFHLQSIDYKNLAPLYVDEPMTLCTKPTKFQTPGTLADSWEVWVQKDLGEGLHSMAFKGTIKLRMEPDPKGANNFRRATVQDEVCKPQSQENDEDISPPLRIVKHQSSSRDVKHKSPSKQGTKHKSSLPGVKSKSPPFRIVRSSSHDRTDHGNNSDR